MQVKGIPAAPTMDSRAFAGLAVQYRPARLNPAGVCLYCETRWCQSSACIESHASSLWAPCPVCDGFSFGSCSNCLNGVVEVDRAGLIELADRVLPRQREGSPSFVVLEGAAAAAEMRGELAGLAVA